MSSKPIDSPSSDEITQHCNDRSLTIKRNRLISGKNIEIVTLLGKLSLPSRGHDKKFNSDNRGVFLEFANFLANNGNHVLNDHLKTSPDNQMHLSKKSSERHDCEY